MKKRVLIPIVGLGSIVHIIRTGILQSIGSFCDPVIILLWQQDDLIEELREAGVEVHIMPPYLVSGPYAALRQKINYWYQYFRLKTPSTDIQKNYLLSFKSTKHVLYRKITDGQLWLRLKFQPGYIKKLIELENTMLENEKVFTVFADWVKGLKADSIFTVTPFLHEVELVARLLKKNNGQLLASIHSFDNVTKRGWPAIFFDEYFVWNKYNKKELQRINPDFKNQNKISITGAPQFDFHYDKTFCWTKDEWLKRLGLPDGKKIILYAGGSANLLPNEPQYVQHLAEALEQGLIKENAIILFRCHPLDAIGRWKEYIGKSPFLFYDSKPEVDRRLDHNNMTVDELQKLVSTLKYTDVHVSICSTMTVDGSIFNKPQISPYYDEVNKGSENLLRSIYNQEHYLPIKNSGVLNFVSSKKELFGAVTDALNNPGNYNKNCPLCVEEIITFSDGQSAARVSSRLKTLLAE